MDLEVEVSRTGSVLWFRRGLRFHDNPALLKALSSSEEFYPIFIYDGESAGIYFTDFSFNCCIMERLLKQNLCQVSRKTQASTEYASS